MAELERPELLAVARENVARLRIKRNLRWKEIAKRADLSEDVLNNLSRGRPVSDLVLARVAQVLGTDLEHLFYNTPDEPAQTQPEIAEDDWRGTLREVERYLRSITDPERRAAVALRLRAVALGEVEAFERDLDRRASPGGHPGGAPGKSKQGGGGTGGSPRAKG